MELAADFPEKLGFLFFPSPYKIARGGRSGAKSWGFARALLIQGARTKLRMLCAREIQKSIKDSVHKLLKDQIVLLGLEDFYTVLETEIRGANGTEFAFTGLSEHTTTTIKSFEGVDRCWVEEGQAVSKRSWDVLIPTIRKEGSEIWVSLNPELETDDTYQRFVVNPPEGCRGVEINYRDNPWHNDLQEAKRLHCKINDPDLYDHIWEGKPLPAVEGAIYYRQIMEMEAQKRNCNVPYDPMLKVHAILDLGWNDSLSCGLVQKGVSDVRIIESLECHQTPLDIFSSELKTRPYNWGKVWLPHDGFSKSLNSGGRSSYDILTALGWNCATEEEIIKMSIEEGIRAVRLMFSRLYFDKTKAYNVPKEDVPKPITPGFHPTEYHNRLGESIKRYRRHINQKTQAAGQPVKDEVAHGADMLRYIACNIDEMTNEDDNQAFRLSGYSYQPLDQGVGM